MANTNILTICPVCEHDMEITARDLKLAIRHKSETGNKILVHCPTCCRALRMPDDMPTKETEIDAWVGSVEDDWESCVPMLDDTQARTPSGSYSDLGVTVYKPGSGGKAVGKRIYMYKYGINPECYLAKNPSMGKKPIVTGRK